MLLLVMEVLEDLPHASSTLLPPLRFQHGVMVLDTTTVSLSKSLKMDSNVKSQITGWPREIHGKSKDRMLPIKLDSTVNPTNTRTTVLKDLIGKIPKKLLPWPTILQSQDSILTTPIT
jgi:hypothetical protein